MEDRLVVRPAGGSNFGVYGELTDLVLTPAISAWRKRSIEASADDDDVSGDGRGVVTATTFYVNFKLNKIKKEKIIN